MPRIPAFDFDSSLKPPLKKWWRMTGSNRRPPACKAGALPAELIPLWPLISGAWLRCSFPRGPEVHVVICALPCLLLKAHLTLISPQAMVGLVGLEPTTPALSRRCSNQLSYRPKPVTRNQAQDPVAGDIPSTTDKCERSSSCAFPERR